VLGVELVDFFVDRVVGWMLDDELGRVGRGMRLTKGWVIDFVDPTLSIGSDCAGALGLRVCGLRVIRVPQGTLLARLSLLRRFARRTAIEKHKLVLADERKTVAAGL
jgi:uncharacterized RDD family membrane protein YckC